MASTATAPSAQELRRAFAADRPLTVGIEEELLLLDPATLAPLPRAHDVLARTVAGAATFKGELPAAQLEIASPPAATVGEAAAALRAARAALVTAAEGIGVPAAVAVHPLVATTDAFTRGERYAAIGHEFAGVARRQLVSGLHVHVAVGGPDRALAVYNALREELPALAALGAGAPFYEGADTGLASVRPKICDLLPRQGVPPALPSWEAYAAALAWGITAGSMAGPGQWWWEARPHHLHGTVEVRVPDTQPDLDHAAALAAVVHALVAHLAERHDGGDLPGPAPDWRIGENRWSACRHGLLGTWADVRTGAVVATAEHVTDLLTDLGASAARVGCAAELAAARDLVADPLAARARALGARGLLEHAVGRFSPGSGGVGAGHARPAPRAR